MSLPWMQVRTEEASEGTGGVSTWETFRAFGALLYACASQGPNEATSVRFAGEEGVEFTGKSGHGASCK